MTRSPEPAEPTLSQNVSAQQSGVGHEMADDDSDEEKQMEPNEDDQTHLLSADSILNRVIPNASELLRLHAQGQGAIMSFGFNLGLPPEAIMELLAIAPHAAHRLQIIRTEREAVARKQRERQPSALRG